MCISAGIEAHRRAVAVSRLMLAYCLELDDCESETMLCNLEHRSRIVATFQMLSRYQ
jgi:hypothetical protein